MTARPQLVLQMRSVGLEESFQALGHDDKLKDKRFELYSDPRTSKEREVNAVYLWSTSQYLQCNAGLVISGIPSTDEHAKSTFMSSGPRLSCHHGIIAAQ